MTTDSQQREHDADWARRYANNPELTLCQKIAELNRQNASLVAALREAIDAPPTESFQNWQARIDRARAALKQAQE
jgi:hypothetical protein